MKSFVRIFFIASLILPISVSAAENLKGNIVLQVENHGEAWYVGPVTGQRYYLKDGQTAYQMLREFGLGIKNADLAKIPVGIEERIPVSTDTDSDGLSDQFETGLGTNYQKPDSDGDGLDDKTEILANSNPFGSGERKVDDELQESLKGRILLQVEKNGEAWYLRPADGKRYYLPDGEAAYQIMRYLSLGITNKNLALIPVGRFNDSPPPLSNNSQIYTDTVTVNNKKFNVQVLKIKWNDPKLVISTLTSSPTDCTDNCPIKSLGDFILQHNAFAGINGSYFCPADYSSCRGQKNYFFYPVYRSNDQQMINQKQISLPTTGGMVAFASDNTPYFYSSASQFGSPEQFKRDTGKTLQAAIGNDLLVVYEGYNIINTANLDAKQNTALVDREAIGVSGDWLYLVVVSKATVMDLADVLATMKLQFALNLDAGNSTAIYYDGRYRRGPGRDVPNAVVFGYQP